MNNSSSEKEEKKSIDIKALIAVIPPASQVLSKQKKQLREKRIRIRLNEDVKENEALVNNELAKELGVKEKVIIVVAGKKRFILKAVLNEKVPANEVYVNAQLMRESGIADNSIATIRSGD